MCCAVRSPSFVVRLFFKYFWNLRAHYEKMAGLAENQFRVVLYENQFRVVLYENQFRVVL